jgi:mono/diheme cytochrome c family protein
MRLWLSTAVLVLTGCSDEAPQPTARAPVVGDLAASRLDERSRGRMLLGELGCVACHAQAADGAPIEARRGPNLTTLEGRVRHEYVAHFVADPSGVEPGTTMPDLLRDRDDAARLEAADALAQYVRSFGDGAATSAGSDEAPSDAAAARGAQLFGEIGCVACHAPRTKTGEELPLAGAVPLGDLAAKYTLAGLRAFLLAPQDVRPSLRMPNMHLQPGEAQDIASHLLTGALPVTAAPALDDAKVAAGRALFGEQGCANCHEVPDEQRAPTPPAKALADLDPQQGCLSGAVGAWPFYALDDEQRAALRAALVALGEPLEPEQRIRTLLATHHCSACHARGDFGGVVSERNAYFRSNEDNLGQQGRLPPTLTGVGAKLQREWLVGAIAYGQWERPYLRVRMPGFGKDTALELATLLEGHDHLPPLALAALPTEWEQVDAVVEVGCQLVGDQSMACISCHTFAGKRAGFMAAIDLVDSTALRLRREWFTHFMRDPSRFLSLTVMPQFFQGDVSTRPEVAGGDAAQQIDALWVYLTQGRNVREPSGMRYEPIPIVVGDEAVVLRRSLQNTGKRAIAVGLPLGVNYSFDAESLGLNQIWWGAFVDASGVWTGQGAGEAHILGDGLARLPKGPAFVVLADADAAWPSDSRRDLGQRFLGYDLDARRRPAFRYECAGVTITDAAQEVALAGASRPLLRRTLRFASANDTTLTFRAALDERVEDLGEGALAVGTALRMQLPPGSFRIRAAGEQFELLVEIPLRQGQADLVIDYSWMEELK